MEGLDSERGPLKQVDFYGPLFSRSPRTLNLFFNKLGIASRPELILYAVANSDNRVARAHDNMPRRINANGNGHLKGNCRSVLRR